MAEGASLFLEVHPLKKRKINDPESKLSSQIHSLSINNTSFENKNQPEIESLDLFHSTPINDGVIPEFDIDQDITIVKVSTIDQYMSLLLRNTRCWYLSESNVSLFPQFKYSQG